jgi:hypothetical protein
VLILLDAFLPLIAEFHTYLSSVQPGEFSADKLLEIMNAFQGPFESHFRSEIETIAALASHPNIPKEGSAEEKRAIDDFDTWGRQSVLSGGLTEVVPVFFMNLDRDYEDGLWTDWPKIPTPIRWTLINLGTILNGGRWRYASCDGNGKRRPLYALKQ